MSFNICSLSGNIIEEPVVSKTTGHIYEKRMIEKYIKNFGKCPMTSNPMTLEDLIKVNTQNFEKPRSTKENSLPGLFSMLQTQMDNLLVETHDLKNQVDTGREELTHSLYQYDASLRVISKLIKERDSTIQEINNLKDEFEDLETEAFIKEEHENIGIYKELSDRMVELSMMLSQMRKERKIPEDYPYLTNENKNIVNNFYYKPILGNGNSQQNKNSKKSNEDVKNNNLKLSSFGYNKFFENPNYFISGYTDGSVILSSLDVASIRNSMENDKDLNLEAVEKNAFKDMFYYNNHKSEITSLEFYPSETNFGFVVCSKDNLATFVTGNLEEKNPKFSEKYKITNHLNTITSSSFQPLKEYAIFSSLDKYWSFHNLLKVRFYFY